MQEAQMLKGLLDGCILTIIAREETYGYKITEELNQMGFEGLNEGTVYPVLIRLEKKKMIVSESKKSPLGPRRKYFSITPEGKEFLDIYMNNWIRISAAVNNVLKGGGFNEL